MSVLVSKRKESKLEAIVYSVELHNLMVELMQRNFGIKDLDHFVRVRFAYGKIPREDFKHYQYLMHNAKLRIDEIASRITSNVRAANSIYPTSMHEYNQRRDYQNCAIASCEQLVTELQRIVEIFDVDINVFAKYIKAIDREIGLIKGWRQRDNRFKSYLQKEGNI